MENTATARRWRNIMGNPHYNSELKIVLLGKTGSGKSSTGNTILGTDVLTVDSSSRSATRKSVRFYSVLGERRICVIDTPGLFDTHRSRIETEAELVKALKLADPGPHVFLLVIRLGVKFTEEEMKTVEWFEENFGEEVRKHIIVLFTHGGDLGRRTIREYLQQGPELKRLVQRMADYHVFENEHKCDRAQVTELLRKIEEMRRRNRSDIYTMEMYERAQRELEENYMICAGVGGGAAGAAGGGVIAGVVTAAVGAAKAGIVVSGAATGGVVLAGLAMVGVVAAFFYKRTQVGRRSEVNQTN